MPVDKKRISLKNYAKASAYKSKSVDKPNLLKHSDFITDITYDKDVFNPEQEKIITTCLDQNQQQSQHAIDKKTDFYTETQQGSKQLAKGNFHTAVQHFISALNSDGNHHPLAVSSLTLALQEQQRSFLSHTKPITGMCSIGKKHVITTSLAPNELRCWDMELGTYQPFDWQKMKPQGVTVMTWLNRQQLVTGHDTGSVFVWDIATQNIIYGFDKTHKKSLQQLCRLSDLEFVTYDGVELKWWDTTKKESLLTSNKCIKTLNNRSIIALESLPDGSLVFSDAQGNLIQINKNFKSFPLDVFPSKSTIVRITCFPQNTLMIAYQNKGEGELIRYDYQKQSDPISVSKKIITACMSLTDTVWVTGDKNGVVNVWDNDICIDTFEADSPVTCLTCNEQKHILIGCEDGTLHRWVSPLTPRPLIDGKKLVEKYLIKSEEVEIVKNKKGGWKELGRGGFGTVYEGLYHGKSVAIKQADTLKVLEEEVINEAKIMLAFKGYPNLMCLEGVVIEDGYQLVMELMPQGSLDKVLKNNKDIPLKDKWLLMMDIVYGVLCLHIKHILHRDLKPENVLLDNNNRAKLNDFGTARDSQKENTLTNVSATALYVDPWCASGERHTTEKYDIFSLGVLLFEILQEQHTLPWKEYKVEFGDLQSYKQNNPLKVPDTVPPTMKANLPSFWSKNPNQRPNIGMVFEALSTSKEEFIKPSKKM